jgi:hypothetical protein
MSKSVKAIKALGNYVQNVGDGKIKHDPKKLGRLASNFASVCLKEALSIADELNMTANCADGDAVDVRAAGGILKSVVLCNARYEMTRTYR